jgi:hypothetical protein
MLDVSKKKAIRDLLISISRMVGNTERKRAANF